MNAVIQTPGQTPRRPRRPFPWKPLVLALGLTGVAVSAAAVLAVAGVFWWFGRGIADRDEDLHDYRPSQVTRILARDGEVIGEIYRERRTLIDYEHIPSHVENAFLAAEDADFYHHEGMDYLGMVRALFANVRAGQIRQGASTITQQVVKRFLLSPERTFERKVQELILARRLEQTLSKKEILELYLNEIYLGHGRYGIEEASRFYFGATVRDIDLGQAALLATLPKAPGRDSPLQNPERAKTRQRYVLDQMVRHGFATRQEIELYYDAPLRLAAPHERAHVEPGAEEIVDEVERRLVGHYGAEVLDKLGAEVVTTVSLPLQRQARAAALAGLAEVDARNGYGRALKPVAEKAQAAASERGEGALAVGRRVIAVVRPADAALPSDGFAADVGGAAVFVRVPEGSRYDDPKREHAAQFVAGATIEIEITRAPVDAAHEGIPAGWAEAQVAAGPEAATVLLAVETGEVLALVGGANPRRGGFNRATQARRQPGSTFKPFVYGAALASRELTAASLVADSPEIYEKWRPTNYAADTYLGDVRLRVALTKSINTVAIKLLDRVGIPAVQGFARAAGIESALPTNLSLALGTGEVTPFELARAFLTLARGGERLEPVLIHEVRVRGRNDWTPELPSERTLDPDVAFVLTSMMASVVEEGTGTKARELGRPVAGKTGTSAEFHDAWFAGFTPRHVAVTWVGFDQPRRLGKAETGGKAAVPIWVDTMRAAETGPPLEFTPPESVTIRRIDALSGLLAPTGSAAEGYTGTVIEEFFLAGTEPVDEAVPAALPAGDVLLDLYGEAAFPGDTAAVYEIEAEAEEPPPEEAPEPALRPHAADPLPSLDDEP